MIQLEATALHIPTAASASAGAGAGAVFVSVLGKLCCVRAGLPGALDCSAFNWTAAPPATTYH